MCVFQNLTNTNWDLLCYSSQVNVRPSLEEVQGFIEANAGNTIPIFAEIPADMLTPVMAYLKVSDKCDYSFLLESIAGGEKIGRYSLIGSGEFSARILVHLSSNDESMLKCRISF